MKAQRQHDDARDDEVQDSGHICAERAYYAMERGDLREALALARRGIDVHKSSDCYAFLYGLGSKLMLTENEQQEITAQADAGDASAMFLLGFSRFHARFGQSVAKKAAYHLFCRAADAGHSP